jgi:hypothetical protein
MKFARGVDGRPRYPSTGCSLPVEREMTAPLTLDTLFEAELGIVLLLVQILK